MYNFDDDDDGRREQAMEAGMLHGVDEYNDAMGFSTEEPLFDEPSTYNPYDDEDWIDEDNGEDIDDEG